MSGIPLFAETHFKLGAITSGYLMNIGYSQANVWSYCFYNAPEYGFASPRPAYHGNGSNVLFADSHVSSVEASRIVTQDAGVNGLRWRTQHW
jgi:prepilin-type processing-associated H-X9-DG protein